MISTGGRLVAGYGTWTGWFGTGPGIAGPDTDKILTALPSGPTA